MKDYNKLIKDTVENLIDIRHQLFYAVAAVAPSPEAQPRQQPTIC